MAEYILVSDKTSKVLHSGSDPIEVNKVATLLQKADAEFTIFREITGKTLAGYAADATRRANGYRDPVES